MPFGQIRNTVYFLFHDELFVFTGMRKKTFHVFGFYVLTDSPKEDSVAVLFGFSATKGGRSLSLYSPFGIPFATARVRRKEDLSRQFERATAHPKVC